MIRPTIFAFIFLISNSVCAQVEENEPIKIPSEQLDYPCLFLKSEFYVIRKNKELRDNYYVAIDWEDKSCKRIRLPEIDFKKNVLIGFRKYIRSCDSPTMEYEITKEDEVLTLDIEFTGNGNCLVEFQCIYWFLIPLEYVGKNDSFEVNESNLNID